MFIIAYLQSSKLRTNLQIQNLVLTLGVVGRHLGHKGEPVRGWGRVVRGESEQGIIVDMNKNVVVKSISFCAT